MHLNLNPGVWAPFGSADALLSYLDRNQEVGAIGFYTLPFDRLHGAVSWSMPVITGARHRVIPLLQPWVNPFFAEGRYSEAVLRGYLQPQGPLHGVGELCFYCVFNQSLTFESPIMQTVFQLVSEKKGIVMVHPSARSPGRPTIRTMEVAEMEPSIRKYSDVIFLFHGGPLDYNVVAPLLSRHSNVYFTMDVNPWLFSGPLTGFMNLMEPGGSGAGQAGGSTEQFLAEASRIGIDRLLSSSLERTLPILRKYPDRIMWGTDRGRAWHFEDATTDLIIQASRQFIARLPAEIQENYAYRTAQRVFGRYLSPGP